MRVIICGAGRVGFGIAEHLSNEGNDISVIDTSPELVQQIRDILDVRSFVGHGSQPDVLDQAGAADADMIIAVTLYDEVNMVACQVAHSLFGIPTKIARVRATSYLQPHWQDLFSRQHMPIDVIISPEQEVGETILRRLSLPGAFEAANFCNDQVSVIGVSCDENCPIIDTSLDQLADLFPDLMFSIVGIVRNGELFVPKPQEQLKIGDRAYFVAHADHVQRSLQIFGLEPKQTHNIIIAGGGNIGGYVAAKIEKKPAWLKLKIIEPDKAKAIRISEQLERTVVLNGSAIDDEMLREADVANADTIISVTNDDKVNILSSVLAKELGCDRSLCLINNRIYTRIIEPVGINAYVDPRSVTISRILQHVRRGRIRNVYSVHEGAAEIIEAEALETSPLIGKSILELNLPDGVRIAAILRDGAFIVPDIETSMESGDHVVIFVTAECVRVVEQMFRVSLEYF